MAFVKPDGRLNSTWATLSRKSRSSPSVENFMARIMRSTLYRSEKDPIKKENIIQDVRIALDTSHDVASGSDWVYKLCSGCYLIYGHQ